MQSIGVQNWRIEFMGTEEEYVKENSELLKTFIENTFFSEMRSANRNGGSGNYSSIEVDFDYACDLSCSYCYYNKYGSDLFRKNSRKKEEVLNNLRKILKMIKKQNLYCSIEIFSGEFFKLPYWREALDILYNGLKEIEDESKRPSSISIPTNLQIVNDTQAKKEILNYCKIFENDLKCTLSFSGSFDGPIMDNDNRPKKTGEKYDKYFYDKVTEFSQIIKAGYHPMVYSRNSEYIFENILWFLNTRDITGFYLLEVRNPEWSEKDVLNLYYNLRLTINEIFVRNGYSLERMYKYMDTNRGFNMLHSVFHSVGRGLGCAMQSTLNIQLNDLTLIPCHRLSYTGQETGKFIIDEEGNYDVEAVNPELYIAEQCLDYRNISSCTNCIIRELCSGPCLGANYETTGEPLAIIPSVCRMEFFKLAGIIHGLDEVGYLDYYMDKINIRQENSSLVRLEEIEYIRNTNIEEMVRSKQNG